MQKLWLAVALGLGSSFAAGQQGGSVPTQALVRIEGAGSPSAGDFAVKAGKTNASLTGLQPVLSGETEITLLIDDGLRSGLGLQFPELRKFINGLAPGVAISVAYMQHGRAVVAEPMTTDHQAAAARLRLPDGAPGVSGSPYFCVSDLAKHWGSSEEARRPEGQKKARFALLITDGVDLYNGANPEEQDSPYVRTAIADAQRAGLQVSSIYYSNEGGDSSSTSLSGHGYLNQLADGTGGETYSQGTLNPVSLAPFLKQFENAISRTYVASFAASDSEGLVRLKLSTKRGHGRVRVQSAVHPGTQVTRSE